MDRACFAHVSMFSQVILEEIHRLLGPPASSPASSDASSPPRNLRACSSVCYTERKHAQAFLCVHARAYAHFLPVFNQVNVMLHLLKPRRAVQSRSDTSSMHPMASTFSASMVSTDQSHSAWENE